MSEVPMVVRLALNRMENLARKEGIHPDTPLGEWVAAVHALTIGVADQLTQLGADARTMVQAAVDAATASERRTIGAVNAMQLKVQRMDAELIERLAPAVAEAVGKAVVIREKRHNRRVTLGFAAGMTFVALLLISVGWYARGKADAQRDEFETQLATAMIQCRQHAITDQQGHKWCRLDPLR